VATRTDVYNILSKANLAGLKAATKAVVENSKAIQGVAARARSANAAVGKLARQMGTGLKKAAGAATRGIGTLAKGLAGLLAGGLFAVFGALRAAPALFGAMREAVEGASDSVGGAGETLSDTAEAASSAASNIKDAVDTTKEATQEIQGVFGAFGQVGAGFLQAQGAVFDEAQENAQGAIDTAGEASDAMEDYQDAVGGAVETTSRFGSALDRIGSAWERAKNTILKAIATAITPALEALAKLMESPEFQEFVDLIAKDLAKAVAAAAKWFVKVAIPAIKKFMDQVIEAGGPVEFIKMKFEEWRQTALMVIAIILAKLLQWSNSVRRVFSNIGTFFKTTWRSIQTFAQGVWDNIVQGARNVMTSVSSIMSSLAGIIKGAWNNLIDAIETAVNAGIGPINEFILLFNSVSDAIGGPTLKLLEKVKLPRLQEGGIVSAPLAAVVGDTGPGNPEVVAPLDRLQDILRESVGALAGATIQIIVPMDARGLAPAEAGATAADNFITEMRARGIQLSTR
jgi:hypothetical protein